MPRGGVRQNSGRKKGQPNKKNAELQAKVASTGLTPLEVMLDNMRASYDQALECERAINAKAVAGLDADGMFDHIMAEVKRAVSYRQISQECAKDASPYLHPRLTATDMNLRGALTLEMLVGASMKDKG